MMSITIQEFIDMLGVSEYINVISTKDVLFSRVFENNFVVTIKEFGEIENQKEYLTIEQLGNECEVLSDIRFDMAFIAKLDRDKNGYTNIVFNDGYTALVFSK